MSVKLKHREKLQSILSDLQEENKRLEDNLNLRRNRLAKSMGRIDGRIEELVQVSTDCRIDAIMHFTISSCLVY